MVLVLVKGTNQVNKPFAIEKVITHLHYFSSLEIMIELEQKEEGKIG